MARRLLLVWGLLVIAAPSCFAESLKDRISIHLATGLYEPQDQQGGGFRFGGGAFGGGLGGERAVSIDRGLRWEVGIQYGLPLKKERKTQFALELEGSYFQDDVGSESAFRDPDASTILRLPGLQNAGADGDEKQFTVPMGRITILPVAMNALWHWGWKRKTNAYVGGGPAYVFTDYETSSEYKEFAGFADGKIKNGPGLNLKGGIQVALNENWFFDFHASYLLAKEQFHWRGVSATFGDQALDLNFDDIPDLFGQPADYRLIDPGNFRIDGLALSVGMRYAFPRLHGRGAAGGS